MFMPLNSLQHQPTTEAQPPILAYARAGRRRGGNRGTVALLCIFVQLPWFVVAALVSLDLEAGRPVKLVTGTVGCLLYVAPSLLALIVGWPAAVRGGPWRQRAAAVVAVLLAAAWLALVSYGWWATALHAAPGARYDAI
jgi:hypothetical protein